MQLLKTIIVVLYLILPGYTVSADNSRWLSAGTGAGFVQTQDQGFSPLIYGGLQWTSTISYHKESLNSQTSLNFQYLTGQMTTSKTHVMQSAMDHAAMIVTAGHTRRISKISDDNRIIKVGSMLSTQYTSKLHHKFRNSERQNYLLSQFSLQLSLLQHIKVSDRTFCIEADVNFPLLAYVVRHSYSYPLPEGWLGNTPQRFSTYITNGRFLTWPDYSGLGIYAGLTRTIINGHAIGLGYQWQYNQLTVLNPLKSASHQLVVKTMFSF